MPTLAVTTKEANSVWKSPDGQREIFEVALDYKGQVIKAKTYSTDISTVGWSGEVVTYEKEGKSGMPPQTFVKQPAKEYTGGSGKPDTRGPAKSNMGGDQFTMYLSYAKDLAVACIGVEVVAEGVGKSHNEISFDSELYALMLDAVAAGGQQLYEARNEPEAVVAAPPSEPAPSAAEEEVDMVQLNAVFGDGVEVVKDKAWTPGRG